MKGLTFFSLPRFAFHKVEVPEIDSSLCQALFITDLILFAVGNHLSDFFLCHHGL